MKKIFLIPVILLVLFFSGCGNEMSYEKTETVNQIGDTLDIETLDEGQGEPSNLHENYCLDKDAHCVEK